MRHEFESLNAQTFKQSMKINSRRNVLTRKQRAGDGQHAPLVDDVWRKVQGDLVQRVILSNNPFQGATRGNGACVPFHSTRSGIVEIEKVLKEKRPLPTLITN